MDVLRIGSRTACAGVLALTFAACHPHLTPGGGAPGPATRVIEAAQIRRSGAHSAWEALYLNIPNISFRKTGRGAQMSRHGRSSLVLGDAPIVVLDNVRLSTGLSVLRDIPAEELFRIEVFSGIDATTYYGTNAGDGVILLTTKQEIGEPSDSARANPAPSDSTLSH
jgi:outer membrane cobalamin receptor